MPPPRGTPVEIRKNPKSTTWYNAVMLDVLGSSVKVAFKDDVWETRSVPDYSVRRCPPEHRPPDFSPCVDEPVEVFITASASNPSGWALGRVKAIKRHFRLIGFMGSQQAAQDLIVESECLRPVSEEAEIRTERLVRKFVPAVEALRQVVFSADFVGCLQSVRQKCGLLLARTSEEEDRPLSVLLVGKERSVELAEKLLLMVHFPHQEEIYLAYERLNRMEARLLELRRRSGLHKQSFSVEQRFIAGLRARIAAVRSRYDVEVELEEQLRHPETRELVARVLLAGPSESAVLAAREALEYVTERIKVKEEEVPSILGTEFQNFRNIAKENCLRYIKFDDSTCSLELCGLKEQIRSAKVLIELLPICTSLAEERSEEKWAARPRR